jgi:oligopeptide transport system substrate-binding protein
MRELRLVLAVLVGVTMACTAPGLDDEQPTIEAQKTPDKPTPESDGVPSTPPPTPDPLEAIRADVAAQCPYQAYYMAWIMRYPEPYHLLEDLFGPRSDSQYTFWQVSAPNAAGEFESLLELGMRAAGSPDRVTYWQRAEAILVEDEVVFLPLWHEGGYGLVSSGLDATIPPFGVPRFAEWRFQDQRTTLRHAYIPSPSMSIDADYTADPLSDPAIYQLMDAPFRFTETGGIVPLAATGFDVSPDGRTYTIHLREDAKWSDGMPLVAQHFVDGITYRLGPEQAGYPNNLLNGIEGAEAFRAGETDMLESVRAVDDYTLLITLAEPDSYFDGLLALGLTHPLRLDVIAQHGEDWTLPGNFVSNGAYVLAEYIPGELIVLEANRLYWDAEAVTIKRVEMPVLDEQAAYDAFESGALDASLFLIVPDGLAAELPGGRPELVQVPQPGTFFLGFNTLQAHTDNLNFRRALSQAVDRRVILDLILERSHQAEAYGIMMPEMAGYQADDVGYSFDPHAARSSLQAYQDEIGIQYAGDISITIWYPISDSGEAAVLAVADMWRENLLIDVQVEGMTWLDYFDALNECGGLVRDAP